jgi:hypothetical protein
VLLNVVDDVLVDLAVNDRLHLDDAILPDGFLDNGRTTGILEMQ